VNINIQGLLASEEGITTPFAVNADSAPFIFLNNQPSRTDPTVRSFERGVANLKAPNPYTNQTVNLTNYLADPVELNVLHMITGDPARTPTLAMFANPDYWVQTSSTPCSGASCESYGTDVWNHGDISPDINQSWMAFVGPGVQNRGVDTTWASETDTRPTMMALLGLHDDYAHQGRVLTELMDPAQMPQSFAASDYARLAGVYTQLESPVGPFGLDTLTASTRALASGSATIDTTYQQTEQEIAALGSQRDDVGGAMINLLEAAAFSGQPIPDKLAHLLEAAGASLLHQAQQLAKG
jgi:hypothetical protein